MLMPASISSRRQWRLGVPARIAKHCHSFSSNIIMCFEEALLLPKSSAEYSGLDKILSNLNCSPMLRQGNSCSEEATHTP